MKAAAMTRIHRSDVLLKTWLDYYSRYFSKLVVFAGRYNGTEPSDFGELAKKYRFELISVKDEMYSMGTHQLVFDKQKELLVDHAWVLYSDADEIVVADPEEYDGLRHFMDVCRKDQTYCQGYDVIQADDEGSLNYDLPLLAQRKFWVLDATNSYHKPALSRVATDWGEGFHYVRGHESGQEISSIGYTGLYLVHLKHANISVGYDFPKDTTGTHSGPDKGNSTPIPEKIRRVF